MEKQITIIDHVGTKAGIDFYSLSLLEALAKNNTRVSYYGNARHIKSEIVITKTFYFQSSSYTILKAFGFFYGYSSALIHCILKSERNILIHSFSYTFKDFWLVLLLIIGNRNIHTIAHDVANFSSGDKFWIKKFILRKCKKIMIHNAYSMQELKHLNIPEIIQKTTVIPHGNFLKLREYQIERKKAKSILNLDNEHIHLLFFGQIKAAKGLSLLIEALALLPEKFHLIIAGKPQYSLSEIENRIHELNLENRIIKEFRYITNKERNLYFSATDSVILPYTKIYQSGVLLMSMSYGIPCVTSDLPAFKEILSNYKNGMLFRSEVVNDLADKIRELMGEENLYNSIQKKAIETMQSNHDWKTIALQFKSEML